MIYLGSNHCPPIIELFCILIIAYISSKHSEHIGVTPRRINEIVHGRRGITADTALRLGRLFNMEAQFWMNLQSHYDMEVALETLEDRLDKEVHPLPLAALDIICKEHQ